MKEAAYDVSRCHRRSHWSWIKGSVTETSEDRLVCFLSDRDWLRDRVIQWIQEEVQSDSEASNETSADSLLQTYFKVKETREEVNEDTGNEDTVNEDTVNEDTVNEDTVNEDTVNEEVNEDTAYANGDSELDSEEFLSFLKHNETSLNLTYSNRLETNTLLRSLCVDALIELSDENADWKLSLPEFINCLTASYRPQQRKCALEDEVLEDGAETRMECNKCVCACGNWVCTALTCNGERRVEEEVKGGAEEEVTEEEWSRRVAELNALQEDRQH
ncbi:Follistatin-related protein 1 [Liparis tanakae]|uniref:Follistatin-related protein 1 n=1 Tax=Liparis tanakae TaxID=230148 RepID=A0A4Z2HB05_9TELE|nr:Follistatin-related protein 1 [Liparis tanakae]